MNFFDLKQKDQLDDYIIMHAYTSKFSILLEFMDLVHDNCTVRSTNSSADNSTLALSKEDQIANNGKENEKEESDVAVTYIKNLSGNFTSANGTINTTKPENMEFLKRKQTVTHKLKHLEDLKTKLKQLNTGILRCKRT